MNGLNIEQEATLAYLYLHQDDPFGQPICKKHSRGAMTLRERGLIKAEANLSGDVIFQSLTSTGAAHYDETRSQRRSFKAFDDDAGELVLELAAEDKRLKKAGRKQFVTVDEKRIDDYWTLKRNGLIDGLPADNSLMAVTVTDDGRSYAEGWFLDQMSVDSGTKITNNNTFSPTINVDAASRSESSSDSAASVADISLTTTLRAIIDLDDIDSETKEQALRAAKDLDDATNDGDSAAFSEKLEKLASIAKSSPVLASILLPLAKAALGKLLG